VKRKWDDKVGLRSPKTRNRGGGGEHGFQVCHPRAPLNITDEGLYKRRKASTFLFPVLLKSKSSNALRTRSGVHIYRYHLYSWMKWLAQQCNPDSIVHLISALCELGEQPQRFIPDSWSSDDSGGNHLKSIEDSYDTYSVGTILVLTDNPQLPIQDEVDSLFVAINGRDIRGCVTFQRWVPRTR